jgi:YggT family protein
MVLAKVLVSYFLPPYQPVRRFLDRVVEPALVPIRRLLPQTGMVDFSPVVLILGLQLIGMLLGGLFR